MEVKYDTDSTETIDNSFQRSSDKEKQHQSNRRYCSRKKTCQVFVSCAVLEGIFLCISKAIYFISPAESMRVWAVDDVYKKGLQKIALHPDDASKKHHQIVL